MELKFEKKKFKTLNFHTLHSQNCAEKLQKPPLPGKVKFSRLNLSLNMLLQFLTPLLTSSNLDKKSKISNQVFSTPRNLFENFEKWFES